MSAAVVAERPYQDYSIERKAEVLALVQSNGGNVQQTSRETGIPHQTIRFWLTNNGKYSNLQKEKQLDLASKAEQNAHSLANSIASHDLDSASLSQKATAFGIMVDKMQLLRGQPTSITETVDRSEIASILQSVLDDVIDITPTTPE